MTHWTDALEALNPCADALAWARTQPDAETAWRTCQRGEWMLWIIGMVDTSEPFTEERKPLVRVACDCARLAWDSMPQASRDALAVVEQWTRGEADIEALNAARAAARAAWVAGAAARDAAWAARAAAWATRVAWAAGAAGAAAGAAWAATHAQCADIVRKHFPTAPRLP